MTTTLTAAALNTLVNQPFTMPDGTTRRALWDRVEETRPRFLRDFRDDAVFERTLVWWPFEDGGDDGRFEAAFSVDGQTCCDPQDTIYVGEAAAHIRVAIEDWARSEHRRASASDDPGHVPKIVFHLLLADFAAMVSHAHLLADALGVEK